MLKNRYPFKHSYLESLSGVRRGDKPEETEAIKEIVLKSKVGIVTNSERKFTVLKNLLSLFGIKTVEKIEIATDSFDLTQIPALSKALAGKFISDCDIFLTRGRLGLPGSGAFTVLTDREGNILSGVTSQSHHLHRFSVETAIFFDIVSLLKRIGLQPYHKGITDSTRTVYSSLSLFEIGKMISKQKAEPLKKFSGKKLLIIGGYFDGIFIGEFLRENFEKIYLIDKEESVLNLSPFPSLQNKEKQFDLILDLTGFGGVKTEKGKVLSFTGETVITEEPSGAINLETEKDTDYRLKLRSRIANTSGTMTLAVKIVRKAVDIIEEKKGVLYAVPNLLFAENLLFNLKNETAFKEITYLPAITVSVKKDSKITTETVDETVTSIIKELLFELEEN